MDSAGLRRRIEPVESIIAPSESGYFNENHSDASRINCEVPKYTIDLSLPPVKRYQHVAADFNAQTAALPTLFNEIVLGMKPNARVGRVRRIARLLLRRV